MIGYHFTAAANLDGILREGLLPRPTPPHMAEWIAEDFGIQRIIWIFDRYPDGADDLAFAGQVVFTSLHHQTTEIVCVEVDYRESQAARRIAAPFDQQVTHDGYFGPINDRPKFPYHLAAPAHLLTRRVPPRRLRLAGYWDLGWYVRSGTLPRRTT
jgi:hypothetical protein